MSKVSPFIYVNLTSASCCLFFLLFLLLTYFTKKNMNNVDNKLYKHMLIVNCLSTVFYICFYTADIIAAFSPNTDEIYPIVYFFSKLAPLMICFWAVFFAVYIYYITHEHDKEFVIRFQNNDKKFFRKVYIALAVIAVLNFLEHSEVNLSTGIENKLLITMNIVLYGCLGTIFYLIIKHFKKLDKKKALPVFLIFPISLISMIGGFIGIPIVFLFIMMTALNHLMFHTIENPDVKLISELELAKSQAEKASQAKSDFLSSMSHELRTPINAITGLSTVIIQNATDQDMRNDATDIYNSSTKLLELVDGILAINKIEASEIEIIKKNYNTNELFESVLKSTRVRIGDKPIELKTYFSEDIPQVLYGDNDKIKTILNNLLSNAAKYTDAGTIKLSVDALKTKDKVNLTITISDTGRGIKEDQIANLFTKFYRSEENKDSDIEGTGLGLAITKSLVELMDGKINVTSDYGSGTTFVVMLSQELAIETPQVNNVVEPVQINKVEEVVSVNKTEEEIDIL